MIYDKKLISGKKSIICTHLQLVLTKSNGHNCCGRPKFRMPQFKQGSRKYALFTFVIILSFVYCGYPLILCAYMEKQLVVLYIYNVDLRCYIKPCISTNIIYWASFLIGIPAILLYWPIKTIACSKTLPTFDCVQEGFQLSIKNIPCQLEVHCIALLVSTWFYIALQIELLCGCTVIFSYFNKRYFLHPKTNLKSTQQHKNQVV